MAWLWLSGDSTANLLRLSPAVVLSLRSPSAKSRVLLTPLLQRGNKGPCYGSVKLHRVPGIAPS